MAYGKILDTLPGEDGPARGTPRTARFQIRCDFALAVGRWAILGRRLAVPSFRIQNPRFESEIRESFANQSFMSSIGAELSRVSAGSVEIVLPFRDDLLQHHGYLHGAVIAAIVDTACGYSALTLMPPDSTVLNVEYKVNFLSPAGGDRIVARGQVVRPGRNLTVCSGEALTSSGGSEKVVAALMATMVRVTGRPQVG